MTEFRRPEDSSGWENGRPGNQGPGRQPVQPRQGSLGRQPMPQRYDPRQQQDPRQAGQPQQQQSEFPTMSPMAARRAADSGPEVRREGSKRWPLIVVPLVLLVIGLGAVTAFLGFRSLNSDDTTEAATSIPDGPVMIDGSDTVADTDTTAPQAVADTEPAASAPAAGLVVPDPDPNTFVLELDDFKFFVSGVVADQETADLLTETTTNTYGEFGTAVFEVDPTITPQPWIDSAPEMIIGLWTLLDGRIEITEEETYVTGRSPNEFFIEDFLPNIAAEKGFPATRNEIRLVEGMQAPLLRADRVDGIVTLSGELPSQTLIDEIANGVIETFGAENVVNEIAITDGTFARFGLILFYEDIAAFEPFGDFSTGVDRGQSYGTFQRGLEFDSASQELSAESEQRMAGFPPIFARSTFPITITGHTDSQGSPEANLRLSEARANSVADYFVEQGISRDRIIIVGKGETEPIASNDTEEGRAQNRRVVFNESQPEDR